MCRHLAYLGAPASLEDVVLAPPCGLLRQSYAPRRQLHGLLNADGFGVGWYAPEREAPARYRRAGPLWADQSFASLAGVVRSGCVLAAVRSATAGGPPGEEAAAPFVLAGGVLFSHNGRVDIGAVAPLCSGADLASIGSTVDSAYVAAVVQGRLHTGLAAAVRAAVHDLVACDPTARLNLLATDGTTVVATAWGDTLVTRTGPLGTVVASEPGDDDPDWRDVPDRTLVTVTADGLSLEDL
ncbi:MAG: egtC [Frankiales bacterium]|nr:egtC [Frankiales bacterium]